MDTVGEWGDSQEEDNIWVKEGFSSWEGKEVGRSFHDYGCKGEKLEQDFHLWWTSGMKFIISPSICIPEADFI